MKVCVFALIAASACASAFTSQVLAVDLFTNGPLVTNPTGGTGGILGQPISQAEPYPTIPAGSLGFGSTISSNTAAADDFVIPAGKTWDLDSVTLYCFQTGQTTAVVTQVNINLWTAPPFSANSPPPIPDPLPVPVLATALAVTPTSSQFVCHRESATSTSTTRYVYAYTVSLNGLPNGGVLGPGTYWLQFSFQGSGTGNVFVPLVTPRTSTFNTNARLYNSVTGTGSERSWFEGREGFVSGSNDGRPYGLPFILHGTRQTTPTCGSADFNCDGDLGTDADIGGFFACLSGSCPAAPCANNADFNGDGDLGTDADIEAFFRVLGGGTC
jgi:hypothetical protein